MRLILDIADHYKYLHACLARKPKKITIASYGFYAGILADGRDTTEWGKQHQLETRNLLEKMREIPEVNILVGLYNYKSCKPHSICVDCERKYVLDLFRLMNHAEFFQEFNWRAVQNFHLKGVLFYYTKKAIGITGGRNFTNSMWTDISLALNQEETIALGDQIDAVIDTAYDVNATMINKLIIENNISDTTMKSLEI